MKPLMVEIERIASCGLYCGACKRYRSGKCPGCRNYELASLWCGVRTCCRGKEIHSCADCEDHPDLFGCPTLNGLMPRVVARLSDSDRIGCLYRIREVGEEAYAQEMTAQGRQTRPRPKR